MLRDLEFDNQFAAIVDGDHRTGRRHPVATLELGYADDAIERCLDLVIGKSHLGLLQLKLGAVDDRARVVHVGLGADLPAP